MTSNGFGSLKAGILVGISAFSYSFIDEDGAKEKKQPVKCIHFLEYSFGCRMTREYSLKCNFM